MRRKLPPPRGWSCHVRKSVLQILSLAWYTFISVRGWAAHSRSLRTRMLSEIQDLRRELSLLTQELRLKDARMSRTHPRRRAYYSPTERMAILELRASQGLSTRQLAQRFHLTRNTIASWMGRLDEEGPNALRQLQEPVNKVPDLVRYIVQRLKVLCPALGKVKIAGSLCRAGLHLGPTTVKRMLDAKPILPTDEKAVVVGPVLKAKGPDHVWHVDLTAVPTSSGFWTSWIPFAVPQEWPFCWWVAVVIDNFSRRVQGVMIFEKKPGTYAMRSFLGRAIRRVGRAPGHLITDKEGQFFCDGFRDWCRRKGIGLRYGAAGKHGSIAVIERFNRTLKRECTRRIRISPRREKIRRELSLFVLWYNEYRSHTYLGVRTPNEVYKNLPPACEQPRFEPRPKWPRRSKCASPQAPAERDREKIVQLEVCFLEGRRHLPVVSLRRAA